MEGFTEEKRIALQRFMLERHIDIMALQETHRPKADYLITDENFLVVLPGGDSEKEFAGVGFLIAPHVRQSVVGFVQAGPRMASLKIRVPGGKAVVVSAYAPHAGYSYADRQHFFSTLACFVNGQSAHGPKVICGDMNARIYRRQPGEEEAFGDFYLHSEEATISEDANRYLLYEFCEATSTFAANTCFPLLAESLVTC